MKTYVVGGAVRDALLGRAGTDRDWVVVGATPAQMAEAGFIPVGRDFPVFLHPQSKEAYALARTERKTAPGYRGFSFHADPSVTLEEDLARRDLTINAMAMDSDGALVDPYGGQRDLQLRVLRHVSTAFREDPVRILRLARFAARYADFTVAPQTLVLAREMVDTGEVDALVPERVWQELARGLLEARPSRMIALLEDCGALARLMPELDRLWQSQAWADGSPSIGAAVHTLRVIDLAAASGAELAVRFAGLVHDIGPPNLRLAVPADPGRRATRPSSALEALCRRMRVPIECRELAEIAARESADVHRCEELDAAALLDLLERCDALRRPERFAGILLACECDARGWPGVQASPYRQRTRLLGALQRALDVDSTSIAAPAIARGVLGPAVGSLIREARARAIELGLQASAVVRPGPARNANGV